jgi:glycerol-3-phosphate dehydrogenase
LFGQVHDLAIIGGGLTGCAIARDAAGRGLSVFLCEEGDLASGGSSATSKLVQGGLHHLQNLDLVALREALVESAILARAAPHLVRPVRFLLPHHERQWSATAIGLGLFAYDHLARRGLPRSRRLALETEPDRDQLQPHFRTAFAFQDYVADDSRLTVANAIDARAHTAEVNPRLRCTVAEREGDRWRLSLESVEDGARFTVLARALVNAAGSRVGEVLDHVIHTSQRTITSLVKSACIAVRRLTEPAFALPTADGGIVYAVPFARDLTLIGPVESRHPVGPAPMGVARREAAYLLDVANQYFDPPIAPGDVVASFACARARPAHGAGAGRRSDMIVDDPPRLAPVISVFGGSLTTHRRLAERVVDRLGRFMAVGRRWTAAAALPGGSFPGEGTIDLMRALRAAYPFVAEAHAARLVAAYGTRASAMLTGFRNASDLGRRFGGDLTEAEVRFLIAEEWARTAEDVLWRRSKLGFRFSPAETRALADWMSEATATATVAR